MVANVVDPRREVVAGKETKGRSPGRGERPIPEPPADYFAGFDDGSVPAAERGNGGNAAEIWGPLVLQATPDWFESAPPARTWLLRDSRRPKADGLLPLGKVGQVIGEGGVSKTMALVQLALCLSTGVSWLGSFAPTTKGRSLLLLGEEDQEEVRRRAYRARLAMNAPIPEAGTILTLPLAGVPCAMLERDERGNVAEASFLRWLRTCLEEHGPFALVVLDPLSRFAGPDAEIDNAAATRFVQALESIASLTGATVLVAHHTNKMARRGGAVEAVAGRGSSALVDGVRWQCSLGVERLNLDDHEARERLGEIVTWSHTKSNYSRRADDLLLRRDITNGGALVPLDEADLEMVRAARSGVADRTAKSAQRETEREQVRAARARSEEAERSVRRGEREAEARSRDALDDGAAREIIAANPGAPVRDVVALVRGARACGGTRAHAAVVRVRGGR